MIGKYLRLLLLLQVPQFHHHHYDSSAKSINTNYGSHQAGGYQQQEQDSHDNEIWDYSNSIPGQAGRDYPILSHVAESRSDFSCNGRSEGGYYADVTSRCQVKSVEEKRIKPKSIFN